MKPILCILAATLLLTGCNRAPDPRIAELEKRIQVLEEGHRNDGKIYMANIAELQRRADVAGKDIYENATNAIDLRLNIWELRSTQELHTRLMTERAKAETRAILSSRPSASRP